MSNLSEVEARFADAARNDAMWANECLHEHLKPLIRSHVCRCGGELALGRIPSGQNEWPWALRCRTCGWRREEEIVRRRSLTKRYKQGEAMPLSVANKISKRLGGEYMDSKALMATTEQGMLQRIERAKFPQALNAEEKKTLAMAAITYGFDPLMGELTIYQGRPYVSIDGRYRKAQETGKLDGVSSRPATKAEREEWSIPIEDFFFRAEVRVKGATFPFIGWGRVFHRETQGKGFKPTETNPQRMAEKRAEAQALRKAFSIPLPNAEDIGLEEEPLFPAVVNTQTGEVVDAVVREVPAETPETGPAPAEVPNPSPTPPNAPQAASCAAPGATAAQAQAPERIKPSQFERIKMLAGENWGKLCEDVQKRHHCLVMDMPAELADRYIAALKKRAKGEK